MAKKNLRIDLLLVEKGLVPAIDKAQALIGAGKVRVNGFLCDKAGATVPVDANIEISRPLYPYVSRGGVKLAHAIDHFSIRVAELICMDVGASTGGFTDCLLKNRAKKVYAVDVGYGQLDWTLRNDPRVVILERTNIRRLTCKAVYDKIDMATIDVSFISLKTIMPALLRFMRPGGRIVALIKPQFEVAKAKIEKGGIVRNPFFQQEVLDDLTCFFKNNLALDIIGIVRSPILGRKGNTEFLMYMQTKKEV
ncbi:MAG: TlyA family RNA methyltransferase [Dissulfurimicrobium sp.]|uniref:TlyA family RNA methyltransferase n=1 Tax=Dissulfurimicrobium sp. TaxID=2022436 RepID=UPI004049E8A7